MEKRDIAIGILVILLIATGVFAFLNYQKVAGLEKENADMGTQIVNLTARNEKLNSDIGSMTEEISMLKDDVFQLKKSCITENKCKGHFPGIRFKCNISGDAVDDGNNICVCDDNCNIQIS